MVDTESTRELLREQIQAFTTGYRRRCGLKTNWKRPLVRFADAAAPLYAQLKELVSPTHLLPEDILPGATVVVLYFLPFEEWIGCANEGGSAPAVEWAVAYNETNTMFPQLNEHLITVIEGLGYQAAQPDGSRSGTLSSERIYSDWSMRHMAVMAGLGTFGLNNLLITENGCCGRMSSVVCNLPVTPDGSLPEEACLHKRTGGCGACIRNCPTGALSEHDAFRRRDCWAHLQSFKGTVGATACGKCITGLPCTFTRPA